MRKPRNGSKGKSSGVKPEPVELSKEVENIGTNTSALPPSPCREVMENILEGISSHFPAPDLARGAPVELDDDAFEVMQRLQTVTGLFGSGAKTLQQLEQSFLITRGCPANSRVESAFAAAGAHSNVGQMLRWFAVSIVRMFTHGVSTGNEFPEKWEARLRRDQDELGPFLFELQGFSTLFFYVWSQLAAAECFTRSRIQRFVSPSSDVDRSFLSRSDDPNTSALIRSIISPHKAGGSTAGSRVGTTFTELERSGAARASTPLTMEEGEAGAKSHSVRPSSREQRKKIVSVRDLSSPIVSPPGVPAPPSVAVESLAGEGGTSDAAGARTSASDADADVEEDEDYLPLDELTRESTRASRKSSPGLPRNRRNTKAGSASESPGRTPARSPGRKVSPQRGANLRQVRSGEVAPAPAASSSSPSSPRGPTTNASPSHHTATSTSTRGGAKRQHPPMPLPIPGDITAQYDDGLDDGRGTAPVSSSTSNTPRQGPSTMATTPPWIEHTARHYQLPKALPQGGDGAEVAPRSFEPPPWLSEGGGGSSAVKSGRGGGAGSGRAEVAQRIEEEEEERRLRPRDVSSLAVHQHALSRSARAEKKVAPPPALPPSGLTPQSVEAPSSPRTRDDDDDEGRHSPFASRIDRPNTHPSRPSNSAPKRTHPRSIEEYEQMEREAELKKKLGVRQVHNYGAERDVTDYMKLLDQAWEETERDERERSSPPPPSPSQQQRPLSPP